MAIAARLSILLVISLAILSLIGWVLDIPLLKSLIDRPNASPMKVNTALSLICISLAMYLQTPVTPPGESPSTRSGRATRVIRDILALFAALLTGLTLAQHLFQIELNIDQLFITDESPAPMKLPGRMSAATATCLLLLATAAFFTTRLHALARGLTILAVTLAYLGLCSYIYGVDALKPVSLFSTMAVHTAISLVLLATAHFLATPIRDADDLLGSEHTGGIVARRILPVTLVLTPAIGYVRLKGQHWGYYGTEFGLALFAVANVMALACFVWWQGMHLNRSDIRRRQLESDREALLVREQAARERAERASRAKDQLLSVVSHELRTPLTPALLLVRSLESKADLPSDVRSDLQTIREQIAIEVQLISDLLDLAGIESGRLRLDPSLTDLRQVVADMVNILRPTFTEAGVRIDLSLPFDPVTTHADRNRLGQVVRNLLDNAAKFTPHGGAVSISVADSPPDHPGFAVVKVVDSGIGIEPHQLDKVFNAFTQSDSSITRRFGGLGIGLTIAHDIVLAHNGTLKATSQGLGRGSTFTVSLPRATNPQPSSPSQPPSPRLTLPARTATSSSSASPSNALKLLIVDDNPQTLSILTRLLRNEGYRITQAPDATSALKAASGDKFEVIICDIGLPDMDGWSLMRTLKDANPSLRGIAISGFVSLEDATRSTEAGFERHLPKPLDINQLTQALHALRG